MKPQTTTLRIQRIQRTLCIALLAVLGFSISCDRDCPTEPPPPEDKGYNFYVVLRVENNSRPNVFVYNTEQMAFVDSIPRDIVGSAYDYTDIEIAADERFLILSTPTFGPFITKIIDLSTRQLVFEQIGTAAEVEVSPNGKFIVIQRYSSHLYVDAMSFDTVALDTSAAGAGGAWDITGNTLYSLGYRSGVSYIRRFSVTSGVANPEVPYIDSARPGSIVFKLQPTADPDKVFLYIYYGQNSARVVSYNLADSSIGFSYWIGSQNTDMTITPDWKTVLFTDPMNFDNWAVERSVYIVNAATDQLETIIPPPPPPYYGVPDPNPALNPVFIAVTPDGKYAMVVNSVQTGNWMGLISLTERKYVAYFAVDSVLYAEPMAIACRAKP